MSHRSNEDDQFQVHFQESPRDFRTEIPNIVDEMVKNGFISFYAFRLYCVLRRIAGEQGKCWVGQRGLSKHCGFSIDKIVSAKKELTKKFDMLNGNSLVVLKPGNKKLETADTIFITDIWFSNHNHFKKRLTWSESSPPVVEIPTTRGRNFDQKKEPSKKEPYKKSLSIDSLPSDKFLDDSLKVLKNPGRTEDSIEALEKARKWKLTDQQQDVFLWLRSLENLKAKDETLTFWAKTYTLQRLTEVYNASTNAKNVKAYMDSLLVKKITVVNSRINANAEFAKDFKKSNGWGSLKINKKYVTYSMGDATEDLDLDMDSNDFISRLMMKHENSERHR